MVRAELKHPKQLPSAYLRRFTYHTIGHDDAIHRNLVREVGADCVPLGSEYCFDMRQEEPVHTVERLTEVIGEGLARMGRIIGEANIKVE